jgi:hypothetical protein
MKKLLSGVKRTLSSGPSSRGSGSHSGGNGSQDSPWSSSFVPFSHGTTGSSRYLAHDDVLEAMNGDDISIRTIEEMEKYKSLHHREFSNTHVYDVNLLGKCATPRLKCLFAMVNRIEYKMLGPIEYTSMVTRIAMNLGCLKMANLAYIERDVHVLHLDHFVHMHILCKEPDHSFSMLYGRKAIRLPNLGLQLYCCESFTLQFDRMGEACHSLTGPPRTCG